MEFEWLEKEISEIRTPLFHVVDGKSNAGSRTEVSQSAVHVPESYKRFIFEFGNAKLYRRASTESYMLGVFASPRQEILNNGARVYQLGFHNGAKVYTKSEFESNDLPIFEFESGPEDRVADNFAAWLKDSCTRAREMYGNDKWAEIVRGPEPFTLEEQAIIAARRAIQWQVSAIDEDGNHVFTVTNASDRWFSMITIGVRSKNRRLNGSTLLKIANIGPGQTGVVRASCYKSLMPAHEIETFPLPEPEPQDREKFAELRENRTGQVRSG